jgi:dynactin complex subunit
MIDKAIPQGFDGHLDHAQEEWLRLMPDGWDGTDYVAENASLRMERDFYFWQVGENAKRSQSAYEALSKENDRLHQKTVALHSKIYQLNEVIRRQRKQLTEVQEAMRKRNAGNKRTARKDKKFGDGCEES